MKNNIVLTIVLILLALGAGFFGGIKYQQSKRPAFTRGGIGQSQGNRMGFRPVNGEIINADSKSITVKLADGGSRIILLSDKTTINKANQATKSDLKTGEKVAVFGTENSDGSVTAQNIQLNPYFRNITGGAPR